MIKLLKRGRGRPSKAESRDAIPESGRFYPPDALEQVRMIAKRGLTDDEMADVFGITGKKLQAWKSFYPSFKTAIEEGRTDADAAVMQSLFTSATGIGARPLRKQRVVQLGEGNYDVVDIEEEMPPNVEAQKFWLKNRSKHWADTVRVGGERGAGAVPIGVRVETKEEIMNSILNLIVPKKAPA